MGEQAGLGRDSRLAGFAAGGEWDACPPSASLGLALEAASGAGWRCPGASRDELFGLLCQWQALESRAAAAGPPGRSAWSFTRDSDLGPPGWRVTQPRPGWHRWVTPSGRAYLQGPKRYPA